MRCHDVKLALAAQYDGELAQSDTAALQEHLKSCATCRAYEQRLHRLDALFRAGYYWPKSGMVAPMSSSISTERIMLAVQRQARITRQLEDLHLQQRTREEKLRIIGPSLVAGVVLTMGCVPLLLLAMAILQPDLMVKTLALLSGVVGMLIILVQYLQVGLTLVTRNNLLLSGTAFVLVIIMGMWLRLMRHPQEA